MATIRKQIDYNLKRGDQDGKRAVIVIIENQKKLLEVYNSPILDDIRKNVDYITEAATLEELKFKVNLATRAG